MKGDARPGSRRNPAGVPVGHDCRYRTSAAGSASAAQRRSRSRDGSSRTRAAGRRCRLQPPPRQPADESGLMDERPRRAGPLILSGQRGFAHFRIPSLAPSFPVHIDGGRKTGIRYMSRDGRAGSVPGLFRPGPHDGERLPRDVGNGRCPQRPRLGSRPARACLPSGWVAGLQDVGAHASVRRWRAPAASADPVTPGQPRLPGRRGRRHRRRPRGARLTGTHQR